jgi:hypothetical protein
MQQRELCEFSYELKEIIREAARALALLDAGRLEELALSCRALNRESICAEFSQDIGLRSEIRQDLVVFGHLLEATRTNIGVMRRARRSREGRFEYSPEDRSTMPPAETIRGND